VALEKYKEKRDFDSTPEPKGDKLRKSPTGKASRFFCVQKHLASHLHYDFRLEHNGVLLSWAVPKGPSLDPATKRLAMHVEDHPFDYGEFEGVIPSGYGAGIVMLWDRGTWTPQVDDVEKAIEKGDLKFTLDGYKLKGSWVLVRTKGGYAGNRATSRRSCRKRIRTSGDRIAPPRAVRRARCSTRSSPRQWRCGPARRRQPGPGTRDPGSEKQRPRRPKLRKRRLRRNPPHEAPRGKRSDNLLRLHCAHAHRSCHHLPDSARLTAKRPDGRSGSRHVCEPVRRMSWHRWERWRARAGDRDARSGALRSGPHDSFARRPTGTRHAAVRVADVD